ncbi:site-specific tyrosine recombinase XerC [Polaromonas sp.]|uniref:site-specific tyrosine recombinase XerC n=1 Tax=Polaromonas sp. TaxID=1869339 RepID=UPI003266BD2D
MLRAHRITPRKSGPPKPSHANPLHGYKHSFCEWTTVMGLSANTASMRQWALEHFVAWADERGIRSPAEVTRPILQRYQRHLYLLRKKDGKPLAWSSQVNRLTPVVAFFKWLTREGHILTNPAADLDLPKAPHRLPQHLLSVAQVSQVLNQPDTATLAGLRDRAILETLYSSGIRRSELAHLKITEVDTERGTLMVRLGKGAKDRFVPLGERACAWVQRYLLEVRPELLSGDTLVLFLNDWAQPFEPHQLSALARRYMQAAGFASGSCHALRHACATHMLDGGADIRFIQALLGHSELTTTQIYTHVAIDKLKAVHALTHPARLERVPKPDPQAPSDDAAAILLEALAHENEQE